VHIYYKSKQVAVHTRCTSKGEFITNSTHYQEGKHFTPDSSTYSALYNEKMRAIGKYAGEVFSILLVDQPYHWYKTVKGILSLKKLYTHNVIEASCERALHFGVMSYSKIKNICQSGSYNLPLDEAMKANLEHKHKKEE